MEPRSVLREALLEALRVAATRLPLDVFNALRGMLSEVGEPARTHLRAMLENTVLAARLGRPLCEDTGIPVIRLRVGANSAFAKLLPELRSVVESAVREATRESILRPNAVNPFTGVNTGDNVGRDFPVVNVEVVKDDRVVIDVGLKGGGSEFYTRLCSIPPIRGPRGIVECVLRAVAEAGPRPCPPLVVGVGVGGLAWQAVRAALYSALFRPIGARSREERVARLEEVITQLANKLGIGVHGFGGPTVIDVHIDYAHRHPATFIVAVVPVCWAVRRSTVFIEKDGSWRLVSKHIRGDESV